jgi:hypothetical protein
VLRLVSLYFGGRVPEVVEEDDHKRWYCVPSPLQVPLLSIQTISPFNEKGKIKKVALAS